MAKQKKAGQGRVKVVWYARPDVVKALDRHVDFFEAKGFYITREKIISALIKHTASSDISDYLDQENQEIIRKGGNAEWPI